MIVKNGSQSCCSGSNSWCFRRNRLFTSEAFRAFSFVSGILITFALPSSLEMTPMRLNYRPASRAGSLITDYFRLEMRLWL